ncbi:DUF2797 domain-containing protein [Streptomyces albidoflavus]|uniref:DUF2797 domain-containing protein n=1 Tax=Streptomyces albidoflavus TaxID=1886 RepID=UPI0034205FBA|nr:DUF2797 domain-containing protein [Streptomyces albidoflavus]
MGWREGLPVLGWWGEGRGERGSALRVGEGLGFRVAGVRRCLGVWRGGRRTVCPERAEVGAGSTRAQCEGCARLDRARSVAADTMADDPRAYAVYLAWFGPGMVKVGITRGDRGAARLLEQGAVAFAWLGRGPLMAARRAEELLRSALGVPDRVPYARKRAVRGELSPAGVRAAELAEWHGRAVGLAGWPEALERAEFAVVDHGGVFRLAEAEWGGAGALVGGLRGGAVVAGRLVGAAGPDLHLAREGSRGAVLVVDTRLMAGWQLEAVGEGAVTDGVEVRALEPAHRQGGLF